MKGFYKVLAVALLLVSFSLEGRTFPTIDVAALGGHLQSLISQVTNVGGANSKNEDLEQKEETVGMENRTGAVVGTVAGDSSSAVPSEDDLKNFLGKPQDSLSKSYAYVKETFFYPYTSGNTTRTIKKQKEIAQNRTDYMDETILYSQELSKNFLSDTLPAQKENLQTLKDGSSEAADLRSGIALGTGALFQQMKAELKALELQTAVIEMNLYPVLITTDVYFQENLSTLSQSVETLSTTESSSSGGSFFDKVKSGVQDAQKVASDATKAYNEAKKTYEETKQTVDMVQKGDWKGVADKTGASDFIDAQAAKGSAIMTEKVTSL